jgi:uncharacterized protein YbjT (DUF2867 family)
VLLLQGGCASSGPDTADSGAQAEERELILVAGASGRVGRFVISALRADGRNFRSLTRSRERALERWGDGFIGMNWVEGDVRDAERMQEIMAGVTAVISVVGSREISGPNSAEFVDYQGVANLVDAAKAAGAKHFVLLTAIGVTDPAHPFNKATKGALEWRFKGEEHLRNSGLSYTIVRPAGLVNRPAGEQGLLIEQGDNWKPLLRSTLSRDDLARVLVECLTNAGTRNATFEIANDPTLEPGDWRPMLSGLQPDQR